MATTTMLVPRRPAPITLRDRVRAAVRSFTVGPLMSSDPALARLFGDGYQSAAGITVTPQNAFTFSAVFNAVNQIASDVGKLPLNLHKRRPNGGGSDHHTSSKLYRLLKHEANPEMTAMVFRRTLVSHALTCHGGYAEIERDGTGKPAALWPLTPDRVEPIRRKVTVSGRERLGPLVYRIDGDDNRVLEARDVLHIHGLGYDGYMGYSVIDKARQTIGLALAAEKFGATYFGKGTVFGGYLETDSDLDEDQRKEIKSNIDSFRASQDSAFRILVTALGQKFHQFDSKPRDSQMDELRIRQVEEVARFFRVPPHRLGVNTPGTVSYASVEAANLDYLTGCLLDWITLIEQEFNRKLIAPLEQRQEFIKHNVNAFLRGTIKERFDALGIARDKGVINADEWRDLEDMNPQEGGQGKLYLVQSAQVPLDKIGALADAQIEKAKAPPPAPPAPAATDEDVAAANERAARAEQLVEQSRVAEVEARERLAAAEASGRTQAGELTALRSEVERLTNFTTSFQTISDYVRDQAAGLTAERDRLSSELAEQAEARAAAEQAAATTAAALEAAEQRATEATTRADAAGAALAEAEASTSTARADIDRLTADAANAAADRDAALADLSEQARLAEEARALVDAAQTAAGAAEAARAALVADAEARSEAEASRAAAGAERLATVERQLREADEAEADRSAAVLSAHRALIVDVMRRMIDRESDRLKRAQATPEKLRAAVEAFYQGHEDLCCSALLPAVRVHLAWTRSTEDPVAFTRRLVAQHIEESIRQVRTVLDGDADALAVSLNSLLRRWETERVNQIADVLMQKGIDHVRRVTR